MLYDARVDAVIWGWAANEVRWVRYEGVEIVYMGGGVDADHVAEGGEGVVGWEALKRVRS